MFCLGQLRYHCFRFAIDGVAAARRQLHRQAMRLGPEDLDGTGHEQSIQLFVDEVDSLRKSLCESIAIMTRYPLELAGLLLVLISLDWRLSLQWIASLALGTADFQRDPPDSETEESFSRRSQPRGAAGPAGKFQERAIDSRTGHRARRT